MVEEGMMDQFGIQEVYGMHNAPTLPVGSFALRPGAIMASADFIEVNITGKGGHAARPHACTDPIIVASHLVQAFQTVVSRDTDPVEGAVISVTTIEAGDTNNVIPQTAKMTGTVRTLKPEVRDLVEQRLGEICKNFGPAFNAEIEFEYQRLYPVTVNHEQEAGFAASVARQIAGDEKVMDDVPPVMGGEDFSFMLQARPGAFIFVGQGDTAGLHHPEYDFNDEIIPIGCSYWAKLVETAMPAS